MRLNYDKTELLKGRVSGAERIDQIALIDGWWEIHATYGSRSSECPTCKKPLTHHDWSTSRYIDAPLETEFVCIYIKRPRYRCRSCDRTLTPLVSGVIESPRVTDGFVLHVESNILSAKSLREFALSIGVSVKTLSQLLLLIANRSRLAIDVPTELGIHELCLHDHRHLLVSNLCKGTIVDFIPSGSAQLEQLGHLLTGYKGISPTEKVSIPADRAVLLKIDSTCSPSLIELPLNEINSVLGRALINACSDITRKGWKGSVSKDDAIRLSTLRRAELSTDDFTKLMNGLEHQNEFWILFDEKERLLSTLEAASNTDWFGLLHSWLSSLRLSWQPAFHRSKVFLSEAERLLVKITAQPSLPHLHDNLRLLQEFLLKPGKSHSPEMLSAIFLAVPVFREPIVKKYSRKASGPLWLEEPDLFENSRMPSSAGISISALVSVLSIAR